MHLVDILEISCAPLYYDDQKKMTYGVYQITLGDQCPVYSVTCNSGGISFTRHLFEFFTGEIKEAFQDRNRAQLSQNLICVFAEKSLLE